jgi:hypothetical protein
MNEIHNPSHSQSYWSTRWTIHEPYVVFNHNPIQWELILMEPGVGGGGGL